jgi:hypothetical protein
VVGGGNGKIKPKEVNMVILYNIIGCTFLGLMAYFLWSIDGWLWLKALVAFLVGFVFIAVAKSMKDEQCDDKTYEQELADYAERFNGQKEIWSEDNKHD